MALSAVWGEKSGYGLDAFVGEKKLPTFDDASDAVLEGCRCTLGRFCGALGL